MQFYSITINIKYSALLHHHHLDRIVINHKQHSFTVTASNVLADLQAWTLTENFVRVEISPQREKNAPSPHRQKSCHKEIKGPPQGEKEGPD